jgi:hypothetical protein
MPRVNPEDIISIASSMLVGMCDCVARSFAVPRGMIPIVEFIIWSTSCFSSPLTTSLSVPSAPTAIIACWPTSAAS